MTIPPSTSYHAQYDTDDAIDNRLMASSILGRIKSGYFSRSVAIRQAEALCEDPGPPPDGGLVAWSQVFAAHLTIWNTWGYVTAFGVFQEYYVDILKRPASDISWVGGIQVFLLFFVGTFSGGAVDAGHFRVTWIAGAAFNVLGIFTTAMCKEYWQVFLAQGLCMGLGSGLMFCPVLSLLAAYFTSHRSLAIGVAAAGSATGGMVFPVVVSKLLPRIGFAWTISVLGFITLSMLLVALTLLQPRLRPRKSGPFVEWASFKEPPYLFFSVGMFFNFWGLYVAFFYVSSFGKQVVGLDWEGSIHLLLVMNGVGVFARVVPNFLADRYTGPLNLLILCTLLSGMMLFCWISVENPVGLYFFAAFYGACAASVQSLFPATLTTLPTDLSKMGVNLGMVMTIISIPSLTGSPVAGALVTLGGNSCLYAQIFAGASMLIGTIMIIISRLYITGLVLRAKV